MEEEQPNTEAGVANDETEIITDTAHAETPQQAWSDTNQDDEDEFNEPRLHPWSVVTSQAAAFITAGAAIATVIAVLGWIMLHNDHPSPVAPPLPTAQNTTTPQTRPPADTAAHSPTPIASTTAPTAMSESQLAPAGSCNAANAAKLAYDPLTGREVVCVNQGLVVDNGPPSWQWAQPPPMTTGRNTAGAQCDPQAAQIMSRSADGYLIVCRSEIRSGPGVGYWEHFLGPIE
ncbi:hypothetical protein [Mycobacterium sp.]|uniref:hypothetical protein n=1 Tax=Mycobacterium sp. TaxID=1785 RepID=UPI000CA92F57|nr:hypothetical protein [Mycobacterium sp.]PJE05539.1 MAG: hypothetical protein CK428_26195 [Mycobacterium sp.]